MSDYKDSLNLPHTGFPMKANLAQREPETLKRWQQQGLYQKIIAKNLGKEKFVLHDGPPYANGELHLGHAINKTLKDIVVKAKQLDGFDAPYIPGWDCHGLPIEHNVEKKKGKAGQKISHADFRKACREYASKQVEIQKEGFVRLGVFGDWDNPYLTMNYENEANIVRSLGKIVENGHLVKGYKPVYWSVVGGSALAEAEVEYQDKTSFAIDVRFPIADRAGITKAFGNPHDIRDKLSVVIWTTTPWTLPSNQAVCLHRDLEYALVNCQLTLPAQDGNGDDVNYQAESLVVAKDMVETIMQRYSCTDFEIVAAARGADLERLALKHPFIDKNVPLILGEHVTTEAGTGCVHTAPDHGLDDFYAGKNYGLETLNLVDGNGIFSSSAGEFAGDHVYKVDQKVIDLLIACGCLVSVEKINHSYAHCWRTKTPLIYRATPQWFISMTEKNLMDDALEAVKGVSWIPQWGEARMELMLQGSPDWCVSRQRTWGVPITLFVHKKTQELHPDTAALVEIVAQRIEKEGIEAWFQLETSDVLGEDAADYEKVTDTLDVWFDSGVTHYSVVHQRDELQYPADLYLEGSDQHRGWFQSSLKTAIAMNGTAPYKQVLTHGFFVDAEGRKMSKSLGNTVAPKKIYQQYGADILRLWVSATDYRGEMTVSDEIFKRVADSYRRVRNTARFMLANLNGFEPEADCLAPLEMLALDQWIVRQAQRLQEEIIAHYSDYSFHNVYQKLHNFCVVELGGFYLDVIKDRQYTTKTNSVAQRSTQTAMFHVVEILSRLMAPILSFTADEIWRYLPGERADSVFLSSFADSVAPFPDSAEFTDDFWVQIMAVKAAVNKELETRRSAKEIGSGLSAEVVLYCEDSLLSELQKLQQELRFVLIVSAVELRKFDEAGAELVQSEVTGLKLSVQASAQKKCERCWHHREDVDSNSNFPGLCERCVDNINGSGEQRAFA